MHDFGVWFGKAIVRLAEWTTKRMGSPGFILAMTAFLVTWFSINAITRFDPQFWLLNVAFSTMSSYAAPLIMLAQNRQQARDKTEIAGDRALVVQSRADMEYLTNQITLVRTSLVDLPTRAALRADVASFGEDLKAHPRLMERLAHRAAAKQSDEAGR